MVYVDLALLDLIEGLCRRFQILTGRTNVWLAFQLTNLSIVVYFIWAGVYFWTIPGLARVALALFCGGVLSLLTQTIFKVTIETYEAGAYRRVAKGFRNPRRVRDAPLRISFLTLAVLLFVPMVLIQLNLHQSFFKISLAIYISTLLNYSLIVLTTAVLYLLACDPLPPCTGWLSEWLRSLVPARLKTSETAAE
ncbi:MAG TPA: hypothetical protein VJ260_01730 [Vicinamibacterales bacterium]|nr:hypothetical protein [Vicinamibacterales bacterium]